MRYWYLDTENMVSFMLMDKGYYDYDYEKPSARTSAALGAATNDEQIEADLKRMGLNVRRRRPTPEQLQTDVMKGIKGATSA